MYPDKPGLKYARIHKRATISFLFDFFQYRVELVINEYDKDVDALWRNLLSMESIRCISSMSLYRDVVAKIFFDSAIAKLSSIGEAFDAIDLAKLGEDCS